MKDFQRWTFTASSLISYGYARCRMKLKRFTVIWCFFFFRKKRNVFRIRMVFFSSLSLPLTLSLSPVVWCWCGCCYFSRLLIFGFGVYCDETKCICDSHNTHGVWTIRGRRRLRRRRQTPYNVINRWKRARYSRGFWQTDSHSWGDTVRTVHATT